MGHEERRAPGISRVPFKSLVDLCGLDPENAHAFAAESVDVSGRGLHLRTAYVPQPGTALVCRFEDRGREIIAEGVVAWTVEQTRGGEFGLMFTALDSGSVEVLRELTDAEPREEAGPEPPEPLRASPLPPESRAAARPAPTPAPPPTNSPGERVRLHIDGLGAPMKALVRSGSRSRVKVGSKLEFLSVGRQLRIENLDQGAGRRAAIDAVDVLVDPQSGVPQLIVSLHYEDVEDLTPEPAVVDRTTAPRTASEALNGGRRPTRGAPRSKTHERVPAEQDEAASEAAATREDEAPEEPEEREDDLAEEAGALRGRLGAAAQRAEGVAKSTGALLAKFGATAASGFSRLVREAESKVSSTRSQHPGSKPGLRRQTAPPPGGGYRIEGRRLRPQSTLGTAKAAKPAPSPAAAPTPSTPAGPSLPGSKARRRALFGLGVTATAVTIGFLALQRPAPLPGESATAQPARSVTVSASEPAKEPPDQRQQQATAANPGMLEEAPQTKDGITANVPLFGPTPMATMEPAPLEPPPAARMTPAPVDETWPDRADSVESAPEGKPWGRGTMHRPFIHRLRLDAPGTTFAASSSANGFSVTIPQRKVMETGTGIQNRDERVSKVLAKNSSTGALITFQFKGDPPPYRVRLRNDFIEFLISSPREISSRREVGAPD